MHDNIVDEKVDIQPIQNFRRTLPSTESHNIMHNFPRVWLMCLSQ